MIIKQTIKQDHRLSQKEWKKVSAVAWEEAAEVWHTKILPKHFEVGAFREYRYATRSRAYEKRKRQKKGHRRPMVFKGDLRRSVLRQREVRVATAVSTKRTGAATIKLRGPRYLRGVHRGRGPNFREELQAMSNRDGKILAKAMDRKVTRELNMQGPQTQTGHRR